MGANIDTQALLGKRVQILETVLESIENWDKTIESGIEIVEFCQKNIDEIQLINHEIIKFYQREVYDREYERKLGLLLKEQRRFTKALKYRQEQLLDSIQQLNKKKEVAENYILGNIDSIFIDKDI